jgi:hypothetical protein
MKTVNQVNRLIWPVAILSALSMVGCGNSDTSAAGSSPLTTGVGAGTGLAGLGSGPTPVNLGTAGNYVILAKTGISTTGTTAITGDLGLSPAAATFITGFGLVADASNVFSTSSLVTGQLFASNYAVPTPSNLTTAVSDMQTAFTDAAGRAPDYTELASGDISGYNLSPATYKWGTGVMINSNLTLTGGANDVWIFQIAQGITVASGVQVILAGGALAKNIFWPTSGVASLGTTSQFHGVILSQTSITMNTGATATGRLLAQSAVTLDANTVTKPAP